MQTSSQKIDQSTESYTNFIRKFRNSPKTKKTYTNRLRELMRYCNLPEVRAKIGIEVGDNPDVLLFDNDSKKIQNVLKRFLDYHYERGLSPHSMRGQYNAFKRFYQSNEIMLNWSVVKDSIGTTSNIKANIDMPYTYEEIHKMLDKCDERKRVIILLLASSGMRRGALCELKYGDLKWINQYEIYEITVYKGYNEEYKTFCSFECASAINSYLDFRRRYGEQITENSYLIRKQFNRRNQYNGLTKASDPNDPPEKHKVTDRDIEAMVYQLVYDAGIRRPEDRVKRMGDRHRNMAAHSFRKFFQNKCLESGVDPMYVEVLMGHKIGITQHYYRPTSINGYNSLLELYAKKAMPLLTVSDEERIRLKNRELEAEKEKREKELESYASMFEEVKEYLPLLQALRAQEEAKKEKQNNVT